MKIINIFPYLMEEFGIAALMIITSPITLPAIGLFYVGSKIYDKILAIKSKRTFERIKDYLSIDCKSVWNNDNIIIGFTINNTHFIIIDYKITTEYVVTRQIEINWLPGQNFIFVYINQDDFNNEHLLNLYKYNYPSDSNIIKFFYLTETKEKIRNIENHNIKVNNYKTSLYYGIVGNIFKCEYY